MRLTSFTCHSLRVLMYLAVRPGERATIAEIAAAFAVSESHLAKVVRYLGMKGLLTNARGRGGGIELGRPPASINIGTVVRATEADAALVECFKPRTNHGVTIPACSCRGMLTEALNALYTTLDKCSLEDIMRNRQRLQKLLEPRHAAR